MGASEICRRRLNAKEALITQENEFMFPVADGTAKLSGRDYEFREPTPRREQTERSEVFSEKFKANWESRNLQKQQMTLKPVQTSRRSKMTWCTVITMNLEFNYVPKEETCPVPQTYIDVTRSTYTHVNVMQEKRVDDYWHVDSNRRLSDSWKGFTKFTLLREKLPKGYIWSGWRLTKFKQLLDHIM